VQDYLVITNSDAGTSDQESQEAAINVLSEGASVEVVSTSSPGELDGVLHRAGPRRIVVVGGDGSLHAVVKALHRRHELADAVIGLVPLGTGNDFARTLSLPLEPEAAARVVRKGAPQPLDLIVDDRGGVVVNSVHAGAGAAAARAAERWKERLGRVGYAVGALITAVNPPTVRVEVTVDGEVVHQGRVLQVAVGNGIYVGGGTALTPEAEPTDGLADVLVARPETGWARLAYAARLVVGRHHLHEDVTTFRGRVVEVSGDEFSCSADGELRGPHRARRWRVEPAAYSLVR